MSSPILGSIIKSPLFNSPGRKILRAFAYTLPVFIRKKIISRWRVNGSISFKINGITVNYFSNADDGIADVLYYAAETFKEYHELELFSHFSKKARTILDIGANTGIFSVIASLSNPLAEIYAFEPYHTNAERLKKNLALNKISNVKIINCAVGNNNEKIPFTIPAEDRVCDVLSADENFTKQFYKGHVKYINTEVEQITADSFIEENKIKQVDLVKIDVESYEIPVFEGMKNTLEKFSPVVICEIFVKKERDHFYKDFLNGLGYYIYLVLPSGIVRVENLVSNPDCRNFIFSKKKTSEQYTSFKNMQVICDELF
ncbi:MAG: FkbM family methyltransferase [Bacteroidota bacterium]